MSADQDESASKGVAGARPEGSPDEHAVTAARRPAPAEGAVPAGAESGTRAPGWFGPEIDPQADTRSGLAARRGQPFGATLPAGTRLGRYELIAELGRGGMGVVYRARRADLGLDVALKVIPAGPDVDAETLVRFQREARTAAALAAHPGIVAVRDLGEADGRVWFAMDLVEGASLRACIAARFGPTSASDAGAPPLDHRHAARLIEQTARALHFAHAHGVLHRDLKPSNILVTSAGEPRIADFGLSRTHDAGPEEHRLTRSGAVLGTPAYMSPEQTRGAQTLDARADVYSLGATLYEALTGETPFVGSTTLGLFVKILHEEPKAPSRREPAVPQDLDTITLKCLHKDPERRYATAEALAADLERWRNGEPILARPVGRLERLGKHVRRNRVSWAVAGVAAMGLASLVGVFGTRAWGRAVEAARLGTEAEQAAARGEWRTAARFWNGRAGFLGERTAGGREARLHAVAAEASASRAEAVTQAAPLRDAGDLAVANHATVLAEVQRLEREDAARQLAGGGPDAEAAPLSTGDAVPRTLAGARRRLDDHYVVAKIAHGGVLRLLDGARREAMYTAALGALAELAWARLQHAEAAGAVDDAPRFLADLEFAEAGLAALGTSRYARQIDGAGTLTLDTLPPGATVECRRFRETPDGRLEDVPYDPVARAYGTEPAVLGRTPLDAVPLPMGSYLLILRAAGVRDVRYPVQIERHGDWRGEEAVPLLTDAQIGEGLVYVPPGYSILGGDPGAHRSWPRHRRWIGGFCVGDLEVRVAEWREFLWDLLRAGGADGSDAAVAARCPREGPGVKPFWIVRDGQLVEESHIGGKWPIFGVSWDDAQAYCRWRSTRDGRAVTLPTEIEWERAARGADGRGFPWGAGFSWGFTVGGRGQRQEDQPQPQRAGTAAADVSPFGVRDLGGSLREWCEGRADDLFQGGRACRGGSWTAATTPLFRGANRSAQEADNATASLGFRVRAAPRRG